MASASTSTSRSGEISRETSTIIAAGRVSLKNSPWARPVVDIRDVDPRFYDAFEVGPAGPEGPPKVLDGRHRLPVGVTNPDNLPVGPET